MTHRTILAPPGYSQAVLLEEYEFGAFLFRAALLSACDDDHHLMVFIYPRSAQETLIYYCTFQENPEGCVHHIENFCRKYAANAAYRRHIQDEFLGFSEDYFEKEF